MNKLNNIRNNAFVPLTIDEQKAMRASDIMLTQDPKGSCTASIQCAGGVTISCASESGQCSIGGYDSEMGVYTSITCDDKTYTCKQTSSGGESDKDPLGLNDPQQIQLL